MALLGKLPTIVNLTLTSADTEYSQLIPTGTKKFSVQCRTDKGLKFSYIEGESGTVFHSIPEGATYTEFGVNTGPGVKIYLQSETANVVVEIIFWAT